MQEKIIGLIDNERELKKDKTKVFPNIALMRISRYYKNKGYTVEWFDKERASQYELVFLSKVFTFTPMCKLYCAVDKSKLIMGGTGIDLKVKLDDDIEKCDFDYSIYNIDYSVGFLTRGCNNKCSWCVVPEKEGCVHRAAKLYELFNDTDDNNTKSRQFKLLDNNLLQYIDHLGVLSEIKEYSEKYNAKFDFNQGLDIRRIDEKNAELLAKIKWKKFIRFSCDSLSQVQYFEKNIPILRSHGIAESRLYIYLLVTTDLSEAIKRVNFFREKYNKVTIYAQAFRDFKNEVEITPEQREFCQRYIYSGKWRKLTWEEYKLEGHSRANKSNNG